MDLTKGNTSNIGVPESHTVASNITDQALGAGILTGEWTKDRDWWSSNFHNRPYASSDLGFQEYEPGYRFGYESVNRYRGKPWDEAEPMLRTDWNAYYGRGQSTWENVKDAVRDAWDSITGKV